MKKQDCLQETHFRPKDTCRWKGKGRKSTYHANGSEKKAGVSSTDIRGKKTLRQRL